MLSCFTPSAKLNSRVRLTSARVFVAVALPSPITLQVSYLPCAVIKCGVNICAAADRSQRFVCALCSETCLALFMPHCHVGQLDMCGHMLCHCGRVHMFYDRRFAWGVLANPSFLSLPIFPTSSTFLSNYKLSPLSSSSWWYLLLRSPAKQLPLPDSVPLWTAWLTSFLSTIKVRAGQGFHGHFTTAAWTWAESNISGTNTREPLRFIASLIQHAAIGNG